MGAKEIHDAVQGAGLDYDKLASLHKFDEMEVKGVVSGLLNLDFIEECYVGIYYRTVSNVESMLALSNVKHFQALAMLARCIFELAVEAELLEIVPNAPLKIRHIVELDRLKACRKMVTFGASRPTVFFADTTKQAAFIASNASRIEAVASTLWPGSNLNNLRHWTTWDMAARTAKVSAEVEEMYQCYYAHLSWSVHGGLQSILNLKPESFAHLCAMSYGLASRSYDLILKIAVRKLKLNVHDPLIENKLRSAMLLPLAESAEDEAALLRDLGLL
jgi:hypothetical protein